MNIFTRTNRVTAQALAVLTAFAMIFSALPVHFFVANAERPPEDPNDSIMVTICHATEAAGNPYGPNAQEVSASSIIKKSGHNSHNDGGWNDIGDIIPEFDYWKDGQLKHYDGKNMDNPTAVAIQKNNCQIDATLIVEKLTSTEGESVDFGFTGTTGIDGFSIKGNESEKITLDAGEYTVTETGADGWELASLSCDSDDEQVDIENGSVTVTLGIAETVTCQFGNRPLPDPTGSITIKKVAGDGDGVLFDFTGTLNNFSLYGNTETKFGDLKPGTYEVSELVEEDWQLMDVSCTDESVWDDQDGVSIELAEGEDVTCTFTNRPIPQEPPVCDYGFGPDNLLENGSFEEPEVTDNGGTWELFASIPGWIAKTVAGMLDSDIELQKGLFGGASDGEQQHTELDVDEPVAMTQTVTTVPGATYELRFDFKAREGAGGTENNHVEATADGNSVVDAATQSTEWQTYTGTFVAGDGSTDITLSDITGEDNGTGTLVDNVVLCQVDEPLPETYQCDAGLLFLDTETDAPNTMSLYTVDETDGSATLWADYDLDLFPVLAVAADETIYSIDKAGDLVTLDDDSGAYTVVDNTGIAAQKPVAMEFAPDGTLYALTEVNDALYEINTTTGLATNLHNLDLDVAGGDVVFEGDQIVYVRNQGQVYGIDDTTYAESPLGTLAVGAERITSAASKDGTHYAYTREDSFLPFTLNPFVAGSAMTKTGPFAWGDGSFCPAEPEPEDECLIDGYKYDEEGNPLAGWVIGLFGAFEWQGDYSPAWMEGVDVTDVNGYYCIKEKEYNMPKGCSFEDKPTEPVKVESLLGDQRTILPFNKVNFVAEDIAPHDGWSGLWVDVDESGTTTPETDPAFPVFTWVDLDENDQVDFYNTNDQDDEVYGCTDPDATNYDPDATMDDQSCEYELTCDPQVNLIANGGFETPEVDNEYGWDIFDLTTYPGVAWVVDWVRTSPQTPDEASLELHAGVNDWTPAEGEQYAELDSDWEGPGFNGSEDASVMISQTIDTIPGETYVLSWEFSPRPGRAIDENWLEVYVDGEEEASSQESGVGLDDTQWTPDSYEFVADGATTEIMFMDAGDGNSAGTLLDNVALYCDPGDDGGNGGDDDRLSCDFTASDYSASVGSIVDLIWSTNNADYVEIDQEIGAVDPNDSTGVEVADDITYTLTAYQNYGDDEETSVTCDVTITAEETFGGGRSGGGRSGGGSNDDDDAETQTAGEPQVLGEQVSVVPLGAANAGAGGTSPIIPAPAPWMAILATRKHNAK